MGTSEQASEIRIKVDSIKREGTREARMREESD